MTTKNEVYGWILLPNKLDKGPQNMTVVGFDLMNNMTQSLTNHSENATSYIFEEGQPPITPMVAYLSS